MKLQFLWRFFYEIHLWLGIISGIIISIICLTGSMIIFRGEINLFMDPGKYFVCVPVEKQRLPIDEIINKLETKNFQMFVDYVVISEQANRTMEFYMCSRPAIEEELWACFYINPYNGDIVAKYEDGVPLNSYFEPIVRLHCHLWIPFHIKIFNFPLGKIIVGTATIIFIVITLSGFVLWLPRTWKSFAKWKAWKHCFKIRFRNGFWRFMYDIHKTVGFYLLIPMLILALTGLCWSFQWYRDVAGYALGCPVFNHQHSEKIKLIENNTQPLSIDKIIEYQNELVPGHGDIIITIPNNNETSIEIEKIHTGFLALPSVNKTRWDRFRGAVIPVERYGKTVEVERFTDKPLGAKIASLIGALHHGAITGTSSKIFFFIACLFATTLPITGVMLWSRKLYLKRKSRLRKK
jgi:uncharacterized iron-regulated membrane protein